MLQPGAGSSLAKKRRAIFRSALSGDWRKATNAFVAFVQRLFCSIELDWSNMMNMLTLAIAADATPVAQLCPSTELLPSGTIMPEPGSSGGRYVTSVLIVPLQRPCAVQVPVHWSPMPVQSAV